MKKLLAILLMTALLLSAFCVPVFAADGDKPLPTSGPWDGYYWMTGGPMISFVGGSAGQRVERLVYYRESMMMSSSPMIIDNEAVPGATYDKAANTLTLNNVKLNDSLELNFMGDDFKLRIEGECKLGNISVFNFEGKYSSSLNITGTGTLTVNQDKTSEQAIYLSGNGYGRSESMMHLDIAPSVTVHLYAKENADDRFPQHVANIWSTYADPAITAGGKAIPEAKSARWTGTEPETVNAAWLYNTDREEVYGKRVTSKSDPDGIYTVEVTKRDTGSGYETRYLVMKYNFYPEINCIMPDPDCLEPGFATLYEIKDDNYLTEKEFEAEYDYVLEPQPKKIRYTSDSREAIRGYRGVKFIKNDDPDSVYLGTPYWSVPYSVALSDSDYFRIYNTHWDEKEQLYVKEDYAGAEGFSGDLSAMGYTLVTEETESGEERVEVQYIDSGYTFDNYSTEAFLLTRDDKPGQTYSAELVDWDDGTRNYFVQQIDWREEKDHYYLRYDLGNNLLIGDFYDTIEAMEAAGYRMVIEDQPVDYTAVGTVTMMRQYLYQDDEGNRYVKDYSKVYRISEDQKFTYGDKDCYVGVAAEDVNAGDLHSVYQEMTYNDYRWWIEGDEYHHIGTGEEAGILGDVDSDGNVDIRDATWIQRYVSVIEIPFTITKTTADTDGDDEITVMDATAIQYYLAQMKDPYHIGEPA